MYVIGRRIDMANSFVSLQWSAIMFVRDLLYNIMNVWFSVIIRLGIWNLFGQICSVIVY